jgi:hypothetical protein
VIWDFGFRFRQSIRLAVKVDQENHESIVVFFHSIDVVRPETVEHVVPSPSYLKDLHLAN